MWGTFTDNQKRYDSINNEWDICSSWAPDEAVDEENDDEPFMIMPAISPQAAPSPCPNPDQWSVDPGILSQLNVSTSTSKSLPLHEQEDILAIIPQLPCSPAASPERRSTSLVPELVPFEGDVKEAYPESISSI